MRVLDQHLRVPAHVRGRGACPGRMAIGRSLAWLLPIAMGVAACGGGSDPAGEVLDLGGVSIDGRGAVMLTASDRTSGSREPGR